MCMCAASSTSAPSVPSTSIIMISLPSLSVPIGSCSDTSRASFLVARRHISTSFSTHRAAYVDNCVPMPGRYVSTALISPIAPIDIKSSASQPGAVYFFAMCATSRRLCSINSLRASLSPLTSLSNASFSSDALKGCGKDERALI